MPLIHILRDGVEDDVEEALLVKTEGVVDNDDEHTTSVEYCLVGCDGGAHRTGVAASPAYFCAQHVHRSVHVTLKKWPEGMAAVIADLR